MVVAAIASTVHVFVSTYLGLGLPEGFRACASCTDMGTSRLKHTPSSRLCKRKGELSGCAVLTDTQS